MIPSLVPGAIRIKTGFDTAIMTGNYECAYSLGLLSAITGLSKEESITDIQVLKDKVQKHCESYNTDNEAIKRLIVMLSEYEPIDKVDEQMVELYYVGFNNKSL